MALLRSSSRLLLAIGPIPFLISAVRATLVANSVNVVLTPVFPAAAFAYLSWIFPGSVWSFPIGPAEGISMWTSSITVAPGLFGDPIAPPNGAFHAHPDRR